MKNLVEFVRAAVANHGITLTQTVLRIGGKSVRLTLRVGITDDAG